MSFFGVEGSSEDRGPVLTTGGLGLWCQRKVYRESSQGVAVRDRVRVSNSPWTVSPIRHLSSSGLKFRVETVNDHTGSRSRHSLGPESKEWVFNPYYFPSRNVLVHSYYVHFINRVQTAYHSRTFYNRYQED